MERATLTGVVILSGKTQSGGGWPGREPREENPLTLVPLSPPRASQWPKGRQPREKCTYISLPGKSRVEEG